jgi:hypothetical protein
VDGGANMYENRRFENAWDFGMGLAIGGAVQDCDLAARTGLESARYWQARLRRRKKEEEI